MQGRSKVGARLLGKAGARSGKKTRLGQGWGKVGAGKVETRPEQGRSKAGASRIEPKSTTVGQKH